MWRAINAIHDQYHRSLSTRDLADIAALSQFHFTRKFRQVTGVTPGSYLTGIRISHAKRLLLTTDLRVSDVMHQVGYRSIGTFTRTFTACVGLPPALYRSTPVVAPPAVLQSPPGTQPRTGMISGMLEVATGYPVATVAVGAFPGPAGRGRPGRLDVLAGPGSWRLPSLAPGTYYLVAAASYDCWDDEQRPLPMRDPVAISSSGPVRVEPGSMVSMRLRLGPWQPARVPITYPLPCITAPCLGGHPAPPE